MDTWLKRKIGAQFKKNLGGKIFAFRFPYAAKRVFHTMWCPPLRIVAVDTDNGDVLLDKVVSPWRFVSLPASRLVLEMDPDDGYSNDLPFLLEEVRNSPVITRDLPVGGVNSNISVNHMLFAMFSDALVDLRSVKETCLNERGILDPKKLVERYTPWERGQILASAGFVVDYSPETDWTLPRGVIPLSSDVLKYEREHADELLAASHGAYPSWKSNLPAVCISCGTTASWRPVIQMGDEIQAEISWRLLRPENSIPFCRACDRRYKLSKRESLRVETAQAFWGDRFDALERWHKAIVSNDQDALGNWDKGAYPLWPRSFGGPTWETGSGAVKHVTPAWPRHVHRNKYELSYLRNMGVYENIMKYQVAE